MNPLKSSDTEMASIDLETWIFGKKTDDPLRKAFPAKRVIHPIMRGSQIKPEEWQKCWKEILAKKNTTNDKRVAYIHIPFCQSRCLFCGFYQNNSRSGFEDTYIDHLILDLAEAKESEFFQQQPLTAVYFGGGTPSSLSVNNIEKLLKGLRDNLPLSSDCEITFESRLYDFDNEKIAACIDGGVNRFSLGVQSFNTRVRQLLGRLLTKEKVLERLDYFRRLDQAVIAIDLMYGLPGQDLKIWNQDLATVVENGIEGVSIYQLNVFEGGKLDNKLEKGNIPTAAPTMDQALYYKQANDRMQLSQYRQISTTHWARSDRERNIYNTTTKTASSMTLPFGAGAGGNIAGYSLMMERDLKAYINKIDQKNKPIAFIMKKSKESRLYADITAQLALGVLDLDFFRLKYQTDLNQQMKSVFHSWNENGLAILSKKHLDLTQAGQFWYVNLTQAMIDWLDKHQQGDTLKVQISGIAAQG